MAGTRSDTPAPQTVRERLFGATLFPMQNDHHLICRDRLGHKDNASKRRYICMVFLHHAGGGERNFYVCIDGADALKNHLVLRDHLRSHPEAIAEYSNLKARLAQQFPNDIDAYVDGKTDLIVRMLAEAGFGEEGLEAIEHANRLQEEKQEEVEVEARKSFSRLLK